MKRFLPSPTLFSALLLLCLQLLAGNTWAAAPTLPASKIQFSYVDGDRVRISWTNGNGTSRIIVMRKEAAVTALPVNGITYNAGSSFGTGTEIQTGQYVVGVASNVSAVDVTGLLPATTYHVAIFEGNGTGFQVEYLTATFPAANFTTAAAPLKQASAILQTEVTGNKINLKWSAGDGQGRILIARKGAPVNVNPIDIKTYDGGSSFGSGAQIGSGNFVIQQGWLNTASITSLENSTTYHFAVFEYNGIAGPVYQTTTPATFSVTTAPRPTVPSSNIASSSIEGSEFSITANFGNGTRRLVVARAGTEVTALPQDGVGYTANAVFGSGTAIGSGQFVVGSGTANTFKISGLQPGATYHIAVFEYDGEGSNARYLTTAFAKGATTTLVAPTLQASELSITDVLTTSATIKLKRGNGENTLLVMREGSPVDATPADLVAYAQSPNFGMGGQIGTGNYVMSFGTAITFSVGMLATNKTYYVKAFEANGRFFPVYNTAGAPQASFSTSAKPSKPASAIDFSYIEGNSMRIGWSSGNGTRRIIIAREGAAVTAMPQDAVAYTANANFGSGQQIAPGQYVIYNNNGGSMYLYALQPNKIYHVAIFEYSLDGVAPYYLTTQFAAGSRASLTAPTQAGTNLTYSNITSHSITLNWTPGNGNRRILIARANSPVSATLTDLKTYTSGTTIGSGSHLGNGNYVITSGDITTASVYGLQRGVRYYFKVIEYNGFTGPVYLQSSTLTGDALTADRPTEASVNAQIESVEGNSLRFKWTKGNGERRVVFAKEGAPVTAVPTDGQVYTANNTFGSGQKVANDEFVVADLNLSSFELKGLKAGTTYHIRVFEYEDFGTNTVYYTASSLSFSYKTLTAPTVQTTNVNGAGTTASTTTLGWTNGDGQRRIVIARANGPVNAVPADYVSYIGYSTFGSGTDLGNGNFVIYNGTESAAPLTNLQAGVTYYFAAFEYNGNTGPVYLKTPTATGSTTTTGPPTQSARDPYFTNPLAIGSVQLNWTNGTGNRRLVVMKQGSPVDFTPVDKTTYTPNSYFGSGQMVGNNNYVVFGGTNNFVNVTNLVKSNTYFFAVFEYNLFPDGPRYRLQDAMMATFNAIVLPVTWINFTASKKNKSVQLDWKIEEKNNTRFDIERSTDGRAFQLLATVSSKGNGQNTYQYEDSRATTGHFYYRIKQVDHDGKFSYSTIAKVGVEGKELFRLNSTVVTTAVSVTIYAPDTQTGRLYIRDAAGRVVQTAPAKPGQTSLPVASLSSGVYFLSYINKKNDLQTVRFVKQ